MYHFPLPEMVVIFGLPKPPKCLKIERNGPQDLKIDILNYSRVNSVKQPFWWCAGLSPGPNRAQSPASDTRAPVCPHNPQIVWGLEGHPNSPMGPRHIKSNSFPSALTWAMQLRRQNSGII